MKTLKSTILHTVCFIALILVSTSIFAQEKSTQKLLMSKDWVKSFPKGSISAVGLRFTKTELIQFIDENKKGKIKTSEMSSEYYLSDTDKVGAVFDRSKVGKTKTGKYIVYTINNQTVHIDEIVELSDSVLTTKNLTTKEPVSTSTLKARSKTKYNDAANVKRLKP
jgi:hypothetical protein